MRTRSSQLARLQRANGVVVSGRMGVGEECSGKGDCRTKLLRCTEKRAAVVDFYLFLAAALVIRQLI